MKQSCGFEPTASKFELKKTSTKIERLQTIFIVLFYIIFLINIPLCYANFTWQLFKQHVFIRFVQFTNRRTTSVVTTESSSWLFPVIHVDTYTSIN